MELKKSHSLGNCCSIHLSYKGFLYIILKIQNANDELLAEVSRILQADEYVLSENEIQLLNEADASINNGNYFTQEQIENRTEKWLNDMK